MADRARRKRRRLSRSGEFERVYREGRSHASRHLVVYAFPRADADSPRLGVSVGRKLGGAVERNKVKRLLREAFWARRLGRREPLLVVPVPGIVKIAQGFDGPLSHTGHLRHALDFVRPPNFSSPTSSIWDAPVIAPAAGVVESIRNNVPDNPLGVCNFADSWGNFVCIRLDQGGWALLAHFRQWSIVVQPGMRVEIGSPLGAAGNSGRSVGWPGTPLERPAPFGCSSWDRRSPCRWYWAGVCSATGASGRWW